MALRAMKAAEVRAFMTRLADIYVESEGVDHDVVEKRVAEAWSSCRKLANALEIAER